MSDIFNTMPVPNTMHKINMQTMKKVSTNNSNMKPSKQELNNDTVQISNSIGNKEKGLINNIKKSATDGFIGGSLVYTASSIVNGIREKMSEKNGAGTATFRIPGKTLGIAAGILTAGAGLWALNTADEMSKGNNKFSLLK